MPHGNFAVTAPHFCGQELCVHISWMQDYGTRLDPPSWDEEWTYTFGHTDEPIERCPKCGILLDWDTLFYDTVNTLAGDKYYESEYVSGDDAPEPEDFGDDLPF